jgi:hypothetical protein
MDWVESKSKSVWGLRSEFAEIFVGCEAFEGFESSGEVVGLEEVVQVRFELVMGVVEVALNRSVLDGSVHAFDLPVGPALADAGMVGLGQSVFHSMNAAEPVEGMAAKACGWPPVRPSAPSTAEQLGRCGDPLWPRLFHLATVFGLMP